VGLTLGGITGRLVAELASGLPPSMDLTPFAAHRF
jgi:D-amino-acid dehydrogenase